MADFITQFTAEEYVNRDNFNSRITEANTALTSVQSAAAAAQRTANGKANSSHTHAAGDISSGTLPISRGGTGQTTAAGIRNAMGLGNTTAALPVANGGTGATTAAAARTALEITPANIGAATQSAVEAAQAKADAAAANTTNADTVDGKHASDFAPSGYGLGATAIDISDQDFLDVLAQNANGWYSGNNVANAPTTVAGGIGWYTFIVNTLPNIQDGNQFQTCIAIHLYTGKLYHGSRYAGVWKGWTDAATTNFAPVNGRTLIPEGSNFNNYTSQGTYYVGSAVASATMLNGPVQNSGGFLDVIFNASSNIVQIYTLWGKEVYYRQFTSSWSPWVRFITSSELGATNGVATLENGKLTYTQASSALTSISADTTLALTHAGKLIWAQGSPASITITVPADSTVNFPIGTEIEFCNDKAGAVTIAPASGVTFNSVGNARKIAVQWGVACIKKVNANKWLLSGNLE